MQVSLLRNAEMTKKKAWNYFQEKLREEKHKAEARQIEEEFQQSKAASET